MEDHLDPELAYDEIRNNSRKYTSKLVHTLYETAQSAKPSDLVEIFKTLANYGEVPHIDRGPQTNVNVLNLDGESLSNLLGGLKTITQGSPHEASITRTASEDQGRTAKEND